MRERDYLDGLVRLHKLADPEEQKAAWRQSVATLAAAVADHRRSVPLEGLDPEELLRSMEGALATKLVDDVEWLSAPAAAAAIYEIAAALPSSEVKRDLGRRVLKRLRRGDAATFVALATQLALGARRALTGASIRARVALSLDLPIGLGARADGLALALISRRDSAREWLTNPSSGSLPSRRLAARLLERAAREAAQRAIEGDTAAVRVFETRAIKSAWNRLLADRESLVWRHVATARGLLSGALPEYREEIERHLDPALGITQWRRAAASLGASISLDPVIVKRCRSLFQSPIFEQDRGVATAMIYGLPRAAEREPEAVEELLEQLMRLGGLEAAEALVELRRERIGNDFGDWAAKRAQSQLKEMLDRTRGEDDGRTALALAVIDELETGGRSPTLRDQIQQALDSFVGQGARAAAADAFAVLESAEQRVAILERCHDDDDSHERIVAFRALRELDLGLLESDTLANLLALNARGDEVGEDVRPLGDLFQRMTQWLVIHEGNPIRQRGSVPHFTLRLRRLRSMLHLVDADGRRVDDRPDLLRQRRLLTAQVLLNRVRHDERTSLRRALDASAARACDALVREEVCEVSDAVLAMGRMAQSDADVATMAEASMVPDIEAALLAYAELERSVAKGNRSSQAARASLEALLKLAYDLPVASSPRVEALRSALLDLARALEPIVITGSLKELEDLTPTETPLAQLEVAVQTLAQLVLGAKRRLGEPVTIERPAAGPAIRLVDIFVERALRGGLLAIYDALDQAAETLRDELPRAIAEVAIMILERLKEVPFDAPRTEHSSLLPSTPREAPLPAWMPTSRTLGGFYVTKAIGTGAVGSVFVARRSEARHDADAEHFALKVPEYSGGAARTLSEEEFLQFFREEAGALLALPAHSNIARFVTFDAGARPKPILVMELVEGPNLERVLETEDLDMNRALRILDGIAGGLEGMHARGIAHLDLKPSNVILRPNTQVDVPVLVDFGLAGRHLRPGCGTASYGAPEVWGHDASGKGEAIPADVYAFGCLAFEILTGHTLFDVGGNDLATITAHLQHDGLPESVGRMTTDPRTAGVAELVRRSIRRSPTDRVTMTEVRAAIRRLAPSLREIRWPIQGA
ncbi:MAG: serine/threonine-protein kinase [Myxococcota bacterium]